MLLYQTLVFIIHRKNNKFKISAPTWNDKHELPDGSHSVSDIPDYFGYILRKHSEKIIH